MKRKNRYAELLLGIIFSLHRAVLLPVVLHPTGRRVQRGPALGKVDG